MKKQYPACEKLKEVKLESEKTDNFKCILCGNKTNKENLKVCNKCASEYKF